FFFSSRRRHTRFSRDWSSDVCSSDLGELINESVTEKEPAKEETPPAQETSKPSVRLTPSEAANIALKEVPGEVDDDIDFEETQESGRASCRGRGYRAVGAG